MDSATLRGIGKAAGWIASLLMVLVLACLADGLQEGFTNGKREYQGVPGDVMPISCPLPPGAESIGTIAISGGGEGVSLKLEEVFSGFWLGATMWKGAIAIDLNAAPGERLFVLRGVGKDIPAGAPANIAIKVTVHQNAAALRAASPSYVTRHWGVGPYAAAAWAFLGALAAGAVGYLAVRRVERLLTLEGKGLVYMVKQTGEGSLIGFSLGLEQGLSPGMTVRLFDRAGHDVGEAKVTATLADDATALVVSGTCEIGDTVERAQ